MGGIYRSEGAAQPFFKYEKATAPLMRKITAMRIPTNMRSGNGVELGAHKRLE
jgi:hypothetical protein